MMPISFLAASRGRNVSRVERDAVADARQHDRASPICTTKLVSVAPRSSRLNSSILPRLRSQPIQTCSLAFQSAVAVEEKEAVAVSGPNRAVSAAMPSRAAARIAASSGMCSRRRVREVAQDREVDVRIEVGEREHLEVLDAAPSTRSTDVKSVGTMTIVRASAGTPPRKSKRNRRRGWTIQSASRCTRPIGDVAGRNDEQQRSRSRSRQDGRAVVPPRTSRRQRPATAVSGDDARRDTGAPRGAAPAGAIRRPTGARRPRARLRVARPASIRW